MRNVKKPQQKLFEERLLNIISNTIITYYDISLDSLMGQSKQPIYSEPRHIAMALSYAFTHNNQAMIGQFYGGRNHATVAHAVKKVVGICEVDKEYKRIVEKIISHINFDATRGFTFQNLIDTSLNIKHENRHKDNLIEAFSELTQELMLSLETETILEVVKKMKEVNGLIWSREVQKDFMEQMKREQTNNLVTHE